MNPLNPFADLKKVDGTWDKGVDYELAKAEIERKLRTEQKPRAYSNWAAMLIQLTNGSRVSETVDAWNEFLVTGERNLKVRVRKRWKTDKTTGEQIQLLEKRNIIIPSVIEQKGLSRTVGAVKVFAFKRGLNTHSLRYAFISHLGEIGTAPQIIAKITGHKTLDYILHYTQQKVADELLESEANK